jgi:ATP-dependent Clp protease ATP-binding subunit ClpC
VILFDELEKAHEDVLNLLLQVMDEGKLTDGKGRTVSFKNNIIVMTSNVGSKEIAQAAQDSDYNIDESKLTSNVIKDALEEAMRPELLNRIDEIVVFAPLAYENLREIAKNLVRDVVKRTKDDKNIELQVSDNIAEIVTREALSTASVYGARPIRRSVQRYLEDTMAEAIMNEFIEEGDSATIKLKDPNSGKKIVEIKRFIDDKSLLIDVDDDAGINRENLEMKAAFGEIPKLDEEPPRQDPGSFQ